MDATGIAIQILNGLAFSMLLFLLAAGLTIIFGMMDFINLAHGSFYMVGAYISFSVVRDLGSFWPAIVVAPLLVGALGYALERTMLRRVHRRGHLDQVLLTFGLALIVADLVRWYWGADIRGVQAPAELRGAIPLLDAQYPVYRLFVIGAGLLLALGLWYGQQKTKVGAVIRAGVDNTEMVSALGINISLVFSLVFAGGAALAALAGVIAAPFLSLQPGMDFDTLILSLVVVVIGGLGTLRGSFVAAILVGVADTLGKVLRLDTPLGAIDLSQFSLMIIFAIMAIVLIIRPTGLFGRAT